MSWYARAGQPDDLAELRDREDARFMDLRQQQREVRTPGSRWRRSTSCLSAKTRFNDWPLSGNRKCM